MTVGSAHSVERTVHKTNEWLKDLEAELGIEDRDDSWRVLRGFLHTLRDRLTIDEGAQLAAQFPHLVRGVFYEGFDPGHQPETYRDAETFLTRVAGEAAVEDPVQAGIAAAACMRVLRRHITAGELDDVLSQLPREIRDALEPPDL
ncbi:MAG: hypothetical protein QOE86_1612 [Solirubrobacteraceae bacterium]|jgi:uncharacterized protein (DUF2267 family)|nr:hypothetical protein [Solirubrobacteraceae bacterium]